MDLAVKAGARLGETGGAVWVNEYMETSVPNVYAAGDVAETWSLITGKRMYVALAPPANKMGGQVAGANAVKGRFLKFPGVLGTAVTKVFNLYVARTGLTEKQAREEGGLSLCLLQLGPGPRPITTQVVYRSTLR